MPEYSVDVREIDEQHKKFILILNDLSDTIDIGEEASASMIGDVLAQLKAYADYHFATEEKYFDAFKFSGTAEHKKVHEDFKIKVAEFYKDYAGNEAAVSKKVLTFMRQWLKEHILTMDKEYTDCFRENGLE